MIPAAISSRTNKNKMSKNRLINLTNKLFFVDFTCSNLQSFWFSI